MTPQPASSHRRASAFALATLAVATAFALACGGIVTAGGAGKAATTVAPRSAAASASVAPTLAVTLTAATPTVAAGGTFRYTVQVRPKQRASYLQTVFEVLRPTGEAMFRRTRVAYGVKGTTRTTFERDLTDVLDLEPGTYPVRATVSATIAGSTVTSEVVGSLRVYKRDGERVRIALVARVTSAPMAGPDGRFSVNPATDTAARDAVASIARRVLADPDARVTLAVPPVILSEWRRVSGGYTLVDGTTVRPSEAAPIAYNSALSDLRAAIDTGRLELATLGYADPNLTDLADHGLANDVGPQYDTGISAVFASLEVTPSVGTAPAGKCVPANEVDLLAEKGVRYAVVDEDCVRQAKGHPDSGVYQVADAKLRALVTETTSSAAFSAGDTAAAVDRSFARLMRSPKRPLVLGVDIDGDSPGATDTVTPVLAALEAQPWIELENARSLKPPSGESKVRLRAGKPTKKAPKGFWKTVSKARSYADAYYAALGASNPDASRAELQSLVAEGYAWAGPSGTWAASSRGLAFAETSLKSTSPALDAVSLSAQPITLSGSSGKVPITIVNDSENTLSVVVAVRSSGGVRVSGDTEIPTTLAPQETYLEIPVDLQTSLSGKLAVEVRAGDLVLERETIGVSASYLDRLVLGVAVALALLGMLVFIVRRTRSAPAVSDDSHGGARYTEDDDRGVRPSSR